jgi:hypothetical protein
MNEHAFQLQFPFFIRTVLARNRSVQPKASVVCNALASTPFDQWIRLESDLTALIFRERPVALNQGDAKRLIDF